MTTTSGSSVQDDSASSSSSSSSSLHGNRRKDPTTAKPQSQATTNLDPSQNEPDDSVDLPQDDLEYNNNKEEDQDRSSPIVSHLLSDSSSFSNAEQESLRWPLLWSSTSQNNKNNHKTLHVTTTCRPPAPFRRRHSGSSSSSSFGKQQEHQDSFSSNGTPPPAYRFEPLDVTAAAGFEKKKEKKSHQSPSTEQQPQVMEKAPQDDAASLDSGILDLDYHVDQLTKDLLQRMIHEQQEDDITSTISTQEGDLSSTSPNPDSFSSLDDDEDGFVSDDGNSNDNNNMAHDTSLVVQYWLDDMLGDDLDNDSYSAISSFFATGSRFVDGSSPLKTTRTATHGDAGLEKNHSEERSSFSFEQRTAGSNQPNGMASPGPTVSGHSDNKQSLDETEPAPSSTATTTITTPQQPMSWPDDMTTRSNITADEHLMVLCRAPSFASSTSNESLPHEKPQVTTAPPPSSSSVSPAQDILSGLTAPLTTTRSLWTQDSWSLDDDDDDSKDGDSDKEETAFLDRFMDETHRYLKEWKVTAASTGEEDDGLPTTSQDDDDDDDSMSLDMSESDRSVLDLDHAKALVSDHSWLPAPSNVSSFSCTDDDDSDNSLYSAEDQVSPSPPPRSPAPSATQFSSTTVDGGPRPLLFQHWKQYLTKHKTTVPKPGRSSQSIIRDMNQTPTKLDEKKDTLSPMDRIPVSSPMAASKTMTTTIRQESLVARSVRRPSRLLGRRRRSIHTLYNKVEEEPSCDW